jgi:hypothetical protein
VEYGQRTGGEGRHESKRMTISDEDEENGDRGMKM